MYASRNDNITWLHQNLTLSFLYQRQKPSELNSIHQREKYETKVTLKELELSIIDSNQRS